jgi:hypothetical protein
LEAKHERKAILVALVFVAALPLHRNKSAIKIGGSPFKTLAEAEKACEAMLEYLTDKPE